MFYKFFYWPDETSKVYRMRESQEERRDKDKTENEEERKNMNYESKREDRNNLDTFFFKCKEL
jgi:hypothetical protein